MRPPAERGWKRRCVSGLGAAARDHDTPDGTLTVRMPFAS
jgi:hypothetical protein